MVQRKHIAILLIAFIGLLCPASLALASSKVEAKLKAGFVVNFARFTSWPEASFASESSPLAICTVGVEDARESFAGVEKKTIKGRSVSFSSFDTLSDAAGSSCQLIYVKGVSKKDFSSFLSNSGKSPIVTVGETEGFSRLGGTIEFIKKKDRLTFKINNSDARARGLKLDASLLNLAQEVH